ncbi:MAG: SulP family inorganic anion transporter [Nitriliruptorales bacterium]|nr:SulP family inorganic anion transporter [Nitriliruptorales bacterium]
MRLRPDPPTTGDVVAGISVAMVLIPQSVAYAVLAGMRPSQGLIVGAVATIAAAPFVSSPWLQTGPVAITSLLTFGALAGIATPGDDTYVALGAVLALLVGVIRIVIGVVNAGALAYLMSRPVLSGFTPGAAIVIAASQLPDALGAPAGDGGVMRQAWTAVTSVGDWEPITVGLAVVTIAIVVGSKKLPDLVPGVLVAALVGLAYAQLVGYDGEFVGSLPDVFPTLTFDLPWAEVPGLLVPAAVIGLVGFAEAAAIARTYATETRTRWDADREFVSQGAANIAAGIFGGFPAGGSFSRSAVNRAAGAKTAWSGAITGAVVLAFLPFADVLERLPMAVLAGIIIGAIVSLADPRPMLRLRHFSRMQFAIAATTFVLTIALAPRIQWAVVIGVAAAVIGHLRRELMIHANEWTEGDELHLRPHGVLYFGSANVLESQLTNLLHEHPDAQSLVIHFNSLGRVDVTGAMVIRELCERAAKAGLSTTLRDFTPASRKIIRRVLADCPHSTIIDDGRGVDDEADSDQQRAEASRGG